MTQTPDTSVMIGKPDPLEQRITAMGVAARAAGRAMAKLSADDRKRILLAMADGLERRRAEIIAANAKDMKAGAEANLSEAMLDRLKLTDQRLNDMIAGADLLDVKKYPTATYVAKSFAKTAAGGLEAVGKLTLRGVTRDLRVPLTLRTTANGYELSGEVTLKRLDFGVGQGELQSTEWVGNEVTLKYKVPLVRSSPAAGSK